MLKIKNCDYVGISGEFMKTVENVIVENCGNVSLFTSDNDCEDSGIFDECEDFVEDVYDTCDCCDDKVLQNSNAMFSKGLPNTEDKTITEILAEDYIFEDVGYSLKNYENYGYRENGDIVILDLGYIYP